MNRWPLKISALYPYSKYVIFLISKNSIFFVLIQLIDPTLSVFMMAKIPNDFWSRLLDSNINYSVSIVQSCHVVQPLFFFVQDVAFVNFNDKWWYISSHYDQAFRLFGSISNSISDHNIRARMCWIRISGFHCTVLAK